MSPACKFVCTDVIQQKAMIKIEEFTLIKDHNSLFDTVRGATNSPSFPPNKNENIELIETYNDCTEGSTNERTNLSRTKPV